MVHRLVSLSGHRQQDGFGSVLEKCRSVLSLSLLDPVAIDLERTRINELADGLDGVWVALDHLLGDGFGSAIVTVDSHRGEDSHTDDLEAPVWSELSHLIHHIL